MQKIMRFVVFVLGALLLVAVELSEQQSQATFIGGNRVKISSLIKVQNDPKSKSILIPIRTANLSTSSFKNVDIVPESELLNVYFDSVQSQNNKQSQEFDLGDPPQVPEQVTLSPPITTTVATPITSLPELATLPTDSSTSVVTSARPQPATTTIEPVQPITTTISSIGDTSAIQQQDNHNETNVTSTTTTTTAEPKPSDPEPPVASKVIRQGAQVFCGEANKKGNSNEKLVPFRIVGGSKSDPGEFPFQVRLNIKSKRGSGICGGVVLDDRHILTAAHCMTACVSRKLTTATIETDGVHATVGDHSIRYEDGETKVDIEKIVPHEKYDACNFYANDHDIAVLKTKDKIQYKFTSDGYGSVNRPCLPKKNQVYREGEPVVVSGWGVTRENSGSLSNILRYVQVPVVSTSRCKETYGSRVTNDHICAGYQSGGKDSCQGDSGGPLVRVMDNRYELVGIVSFGYGCGQPGAPGVYTKVANYMDWIDANL